MLKSILSIGLAALAILMIVVAMTNSADEAKAQQNSANGRGVTTEDMIIRP
jgi:predicted acyltransferase